MTTYARSFPLPRAVRQPLPPRPAREVQGLRARAGLVAGASRRADARLPVRVQPAVADPDRGLRPLLALPARRSAGLGVLRNVAPDDVADPARERQPDPQGPLSAPTRAALHGRDAGRRLRRHARDRRGAQPRLRSRGARHGLAGPPAVGARGLPRRGHVARSRVAERRLPRRRASHRRAAPPVVLRHTRALFAREHSGRRRPSAPRRRSSTGATRSRLPSRPCATRSSSARSPRWATRSTSPCRRWSRWCWARSSSTGWTTASPSRSEP